MKKMLVLLVAVIAFASCKKERKSCWSCYFPISDTASYFDTTVCDMTSEESKKFQSEHVQILREKHGPIEPGVGSSCIQSSGKYE